MTQLDDSLASKQRLPCGFQLFLLDWPKIEVQGGLTRGQLQLQTCRTLGGNTCWCVSSCREQIRVLDPQMRQTPIFSLNNTRVCFPQPADKFQVQTIRKWMSTPMLSAWGLPQNGECKDLKTDPNSAEFSQGV